MIRTATDSAEEMAKLPDGKLFEILRENADEYSRIEDYASTENRLQILESSLAGERTVIASTCYWGQ